MKRSINSPVTVSALDISTGHITKKDDSLIQNSNCDAKSPLVAYGYPEGYFVYVSEAIYSTSEAKEEYIQSLKDFGMSTQFIKILQRAAVRAIKYVQFDADGTVYDDLKKFDW